MENWIKKSIDEALGEIIKQLPNLVRNARDTGLRKRLSLQSDTDYMLGYTVGFVQASIMCNIKMSGEQLTEALIKEINNYLIISLDPFRDIFRRTGE